MVRENHRGKERGGWIWIGGEGMRGEQVVGEEKGRQLRDCGPVVVRRYGAPQGSIRHTAPVPIVGGAGHRYGVLQVPICLTAPGPGYNIHPMGSCYPYIPCACLIFSTSPPHPFAPIPHNTPLAPLTILPMQQFHHL